MQNNIYKSCLKSLVDCFIIIMTVILCIASLAGIVYLSVFLSTFLNLNGMKIAGTEVAVILTIVSLIFIVIIGFLSVLRLNIDNLNHKKNILITIYILIASIIVNYCVLFPIFSPISIM